MDEQELIKKLEETKAKRIETVAKLEKQLAELEAKAAKKRNSKS